MRGEAMLGPVTLDGTYAISQHTLFGHDAKARLAYDGAFVFRGAGIKQGPLTVKGFAYLLDYDTAEQAGPLAVSLADTQTYGVRATAALPVSKQIKLNLAASYASQSAYKQNPAKYALNYFAGEAGLAYSGWTLNGGYELLGSDNGHALQTPMATLHKFNGWADLFLTTPAADLQEVYAGLAKAFPIVKALPGLNAGIGWHAHHSDVGNVR